MQVTFKRLLRFRVISYSSKKLIKDVVK